ncbi:hypothetical protein Ocin01_19662 [Orchesella cincta]|uniref:Uncharacterized protein n=1 Tax=Orchesella cincta TaxID=48709 RepID=A0A1D2M223_ORCCI|nr:hypothetical protein Ocin01_19662 [Orchesella cincta]
MPSAEPTFPKKLTIPSTSTSDKESDTVKKSSTPQPESLASLRRESSLKKEEFNNRNSSPETKVRNKNDLGSHQNKEIPKTSTTTTVTTRPAITSPAFRNQKAMEIMDVAKRLIMNRTGSPDVNKALKRSGSPVVQIKKRAGSPEQSGKVKKAVTASEQSEKIKKTDNTRKPVGLPDIQERIKNAVRASQITNKGKTPVQNDALKKTTGSVATSDTVTKALELLQNNSSVMKKKMLKNTTTTVAVRTPTNLVKTLPQQEKPKMGDAQTQTDDLIIVPQITKRAFSPVGISNKLVKVSKSYDASSEELCESPSPRSRTPVSALELSRLSSATPIHHPALAPNTSGSAESESSPTEIYQSPSSPQPGCSHWNTQKISFDQRTNERLSGQETVTPAFDLEDSDDTMPVGSEASNVNQNVGQLFHLMNQPHVFKAGIGLIEKMTTNSPRKRDLSPDICELVPDKRLKQVVAAASRRSRRDSFDEADSEDPTQALVLRRGNDDEAIALEGSGEACLFDYISKSRHNAVNAYEPRGDEFDLSQRSYCMLNVVPHYELKSRLYKIHSKAVRETSVPLISEHFKVITPQLVDIFQGRLSSVRHTIYLRGYEGKRDLRSLMVVSYLTPAAKVML